MIPGDSGEMCPDLKVCIDFFIFTDLLELS